MNDDDIDNMDFALPQELMPQNSAMNPFAQMMQAAPMQQIQPPHQEALLQETKNWTCVYPIYIDKSKSIDKGRKIPMEFCVEEPAAIYMVEAATKLGLMAGLEANKRHAKDPLVFGRIRVKLKDEGGRFLHSTIHTKRQLLIEIAKIVDEVKRTAPDPDGRFKTFANQSRSVLVWPEEPAGPSKPTKVSKKKK
jgi:signal recognition particle subunit SRP19